MRCDLDVEEHGPAHRPRTQTAAAGHEHEAARHLEMREAQARRSVDFEHPLDRAAVDGGRAIRHPGDVDFLEHVEIADGGLAVGAGEAEEQVAHLRVVYPDQVAIEAGAAAVHRGVGVGGADRVAQTAVAVRRREISVGVDDDGVAVLVRPDVRARDRVEIAVARPALGALIERGEVGGIAVVERGASGQQAARARRAPQSASASSFGSKPTRSVAAGTRPQSSRWIRLKPCVVMVAISL